MDLLLSSSEFLESGGVGVEGVSGLHSCLMQLPVDLPSLSIGGIDLCTDVSPIGDSILSSKDLDDLPQIRFGYDLSLSKLAHDVCFGYGFNAYFEYKHEIKDSYFFQDYAVEHGYELSKNFLLEMNYYNSRFSDTVNISLKDNNFFPREGRSISSSIKPLSLYACCLDLDCSYFYKSVCRCRPKIIDILKKEFIPEIIKTILEGMVVDSTGTRSMTYHEMEMFFLHFVTSLERMIVKIMMSRWYSYCEDNKLILSQLSSSSEYKYYDYSNPLCRLKTCGKVGMHDRDVDYPLAFVEVSGVTISLIAKHKIDVLSGDFVTKFCSSLKTVLHDRLTKISNHSSYDYEDNFKVFSDVELPILIKESFDGCISNFRCELSKFLSGLAVWLPQEVEYSDNKVDFSKLVEDVESSVYSVLKFRICNISSYLVKNCIVKIDNFLSRISSKSSTYMVDRWGFNLCHKFEYNYSSIRKKFSPICKTIINGKFREMVLNGFAVNEWKVVSPKLFPIALESLKDVYKNEYDELDMLVSNTHVIDSDGGFVKLTDSDKDLLCKKIVTRINKEFRDLVRICWVDISNSISASVHVPDVDSSVDSDVVGSSSIFHTAIPSIDDSIDSDTNENSSQIPLGVDKGGYFPANCEEEVVEIDELGNLFESFMDRLASDGNYSVMKNIEELISCNLSAPVDIVPEQSLSGLSPPVEIVPEKFDFDSAWGGFDSVLGNGKRASDRSLDADYPNSYKRNRDHEIAGIAVTEEDVPDTSKAPDLVSFSGLYINSASDNNLNMMIKDHITQVSVGIRSIVNELESKFLSVSDFGDFSDEAANQVKLAGERFLSQFTDQLGNFFVNIPVWDDFGKTNSGKRLITDSERDNIIRCLSLSISMQQDQISSIELSSMLSRVSNIGK